MCKKGRNFSSCGTLIYKHGVRQELEIAYKIWQAVLLPLILKFKQKLADQQWTIYLTTDLVAERDITLHIILD